MVDSCSTPSHHKVDAILISSNGDHGMQFRVCGSSLRSDISSAKSRPNPGNGTDK
jgi:hypothetical protein